MKENHTSNGMFMGFKWKNVRILHGAETTTFIQIASLWYYYSFYEKIFEKKTFLNHHVASWLFIIIKWFAKCDIYFYTFKELTKICVKLNFFYWDKLFLNSLFSRWKVKNHIYQFQSWWW